MAADQDRPGQDGGAGGQPAEVDQTLLLLECVGAFLLDPLPTARSRPFLDRFSTLYLPPSRPKPHHKLMLTRRLVGSSQVDGVRRIKIAQNLLTRWVSIRPALAHSRAQPPSSTREGG